MSTNNALKSKGQRALLAKCAELNVCEEKLGRAINKLYPELYLLFHCKFYNPCNYINVWEKTGLIGHDKKKT